MARAEAMQTLTQHRIRIGGRVVDYRLVHSKAARKLRVRVGPGGVEVVQPSTRTGEEVSDFLLSNGSWILDHLNRAERLRSLRRPVTHPAGQILFRGEATPVRIEFELNHAPQATRCVSLRARSSCHGDRVRKRLLSTALSNG